jgi:hypothetical protein
MSRLSRYNVLRAGPGRRPTTSRSADRHGTPGAVEWPDKNDQRLAAKPASTLSCSLICLAYDFEQIVQLPRVGSKKKILRRPIMRRRVCVVKLKKNAPPEPSASDQSRRSNLVAEQRLLPHSGHSSPSPRTAQVGGFQSFPICPTCDARAVKADFAYRRGKDGSEASRSCRFTCRQPQA